MGDPVLRSILKEFNKEISGSLLSDADRIPHLKILYCHGSGHITYKLNFRFLGTLSQRIVNHRDNLNSIKSCSMLVNLWQCSHLPIAYDTELKERHNEIRGKSWHDGRSIERDGYTVINEPLNHENSDTMTSCLKRGHASGKNWQLPIETKMERTTDLFMLSYNGLFNHVTTAP